MSHAVITLINVINSHLAPRSFSSTLFFSSLFVSPLLRPSSSSSLAVFFFFFFGLISLLAGAY